MVTPLWVTRLSDSMAAAAKHRFGAAVMEGTLLRGRWLQDAGMEILDPIKQTCFTFV